MRFPLALCVAAMLAATPGWGAEPGSPAPSLGVLPVAGPISAIPASLADAALELDDERLPVEDGAGKGNVHRTREGTELIEVLGTFRASGDRFVFQSDDRQHKLTPLENLALERIARALKEGSGSGAWVVSGTVTEFQGTNFLFITRAILKQRSGVDDPLNRKTAAR